MKNPIEQIEHIADRGGFVEFLFALSRNAKNHPEEWSNRTVADYLEQMASWIEDAYPSNGIVDWESVDYQVLAKILYMGKIYE